MELHQTQKLVAVDNHDFRIVDCGRQWGKTTLAVEEGRACAYAKGGRDIGYLASTFDQARNVAWVQFKEKTRPIWIRPPNESRLELQVRAQDGGESRISLGGYENIETYRGRQFDLLIPDEVALMRNFEYNWQAVLEPTLAFRHGKALFLSTPKGFDHFHKLWELGQTDNPTYKSWKFTSYDNPFLDKERIEQAKKTSTEDYFAQEYLADFRKRTGLVYKEFQREAHVIQPFDIPDGWSIYRAMDFGSTNPTVCLWIAVDPDDNWFVYQEHYETKSGIDYHAGIINSRSTSGNILATYGDPSGAQWITEFAQRGIYITPATKETSTAFNTWVRYKIEKVAEKLKPIPGHLVATLNGGEGRLVGAPSLFVFSTCVNTIREFETYRWKEKSVTQAQDLNEPDVPEKANDHAMDALSYFACSYKKQDSNWDTINQGLNKKWSI